VNDKGFIAYPLHTNRIHSNKVFGLSKGNGKRKKDKTKNDEFGRERHVAREMVESKLGNTETKIMLKDRLLAKVYEKEPIIPTRTLAFGGSYSKLVTRARTFC
jgi:hypothetical protein